MNSNKHYTREELDAFLIESNKIEGIKEEMDEYEVDAMDDFLYLKEVKIEHIVDIVSVFQQGAELRNKIGLDVRVGDHIPPRGNSEIETDLEKILDNVHPKGESGFSNKNSFENHVDYETLHPFTDGNGRSGRMLWAWQMVNTNVWPGIHLGFLHAFYYQSLQSFRDNH